MSQQLPHQLLALLQGFGVGIQAGRHVQQCSTAQRAIRAGFDANQAVLQQKLIMRPGFDPNSQPDPREPENIERPSGRGMLLMRSFMDRVEYNATGNMVTLEKKTTVCPTLPTPE